MIFQGHKRQQLSNSFLQNLSYICVVQTPTTMNNNPQNPEFIFASQADQCLQTMKIRAEQMHIQGVGLVAYYNSKTANWTSKMVVMGALKNETVNFLSVAYSKAGEMIDTFQNSGTTARVPLLGEFNFKGGVISKVQENYVLVVFSGASGEEDTIVAQQGLDFLLSTLT